MLVSAAHETDSWFGRDLHAGLTTDKSVLGIRYIATVSDVRVVGLRSKTVALEHTHQIQSVSDPSV